MAGALGKRAVSWGKESGENNKENDKEKEREKEKETDSARKLPIPPPSHPSVPHPHPHAESPTSRAGTLGPPPLPKRNIAQGKAVTDTVVPPSDAQNEIDAPEAKEPDANTDGHGDPDKAESNASDLSTSVEEIIFTPPPSATGHYVASRLSRAECATRRRSIIFTNPAQRPSSHDTHHSESHLARDVLSSASPLASLLACVAATEFAPLQPAVSRSCALMPTLMVTMTIKQLIHRRADLVTISNPLSSLGQVSANNSPMARLSWHDTLSRDSLRIITANPTAESCDNSSRKTLSASRFSLSPST